MFERFTDRARRVVVLAQVEARGLGHNYIGTEHLLLGLTSEGQGVAALVLTDLGVTLRSVRGDIEEIIGRGTDIPAGHIPFTPRAKKVLELALREALQLGHNYIGTEHILLGLIREGEGVAAQVLAKRGVDVQSARERVVSMLEKRGLVDPVVVPARAEHLADILAEGLLGEIGADELPLAVSELLRRGERFRYLAARMLSDAGLDVSRSLEVVLGMLVDPERLARTEQRFQIDPRAGPPGDASGTEETEADPPT